MRICHISTFWPHPMGHTHYTDALIEGMRGHNPERHFVAAEVGSDPLDNEAVRCVPCFSRGEDYVDGIAATVRAFGADVALLQHSPDLFGQDERLVRLLRRLREQGVATVLNSHSIYPQSWTTEFEPGRDWGHLDRALGQEASCFTVHSARMRQDLLDRGVPAHKVVVIPHGSRAMELRDPAESRRTLDLSPSGRVVLFFGFIWLGKGLDFLLDVFARVAGRVPDAQLYIGGYMSSKALYNRAYMAYLRARILKLGIQRRTRLYGDYVPDDLVPVLYSAADVVAMPYRQDYSSVSGVLHQTAGTGKLMLCSRISKFDEVTREISPLLTVGAKDHEGWTRGLTRLLTDEPFRAAMSEKIQDFARRTSWDRVGRMHLDLYERIRP